MKLAPVERSGGWRPSGSDARVAAVSRLQTVTSETAGQSVAPALSSGRELPVLAVQRGSLAQARPVLQSDKPQDGDATTRAAAGATSIATVDLFASSSPSATLGSADSSAESTGTAAASGAAHGAKRHDKGLSAASSDTKTPAGSSPSSASSASSAAAATQSPKVTVASIAAEQAADAARHQAAEQAKNEPPKEPISKMLLDLVHSVWAASGSVVDAASTSSKARSASPAKPGAVAAATYTANAVSRSPQSSAS